MANGAHAQRLLTGTVVENTNGAAIPFAVVELPGYHLGTQANSVGQFRLVLPSGLALTDSLTVSALGYQRRRVAVPATEACRLLLASQALPLAEVMVRPTKEAPVVLGPTTGKFDQTGFSGSGLSPTNNKGWQIARCFAAPTTGYLTEARFYLKAKGNFGCKQYMTPFRVRVYAADGPNKGPGTDLLFESLLVAATKPGWLTVDLRRFNLPVPPAGFYVAMEWLYISDAYLCPYSYLDSQTKEKRTGVAYGQSLGGQLMADTQTWYLSAGYPWQRTMPHPAPGSRTTQAIGAAIQAVVQP